MCSSDLGGRAETIVPLRVGSHGTAVDARHTLFLEDLDVHPGDFISYYVRAFDLARGRSSNEARSDIFFLEVKPFDQEFSLAQSQAAGGGGPNRSIDDLVAAQKEVIVATWKLDRRTRAAAAAKSEQDIRSVARAEAELKTRVEEASSSFRESTMRDPRRRGGQQGRGGQPAGPRAGQTLPEEDAMTAAAAAMGNAVSFLNDLETSLALPPEMEGLNHLLKAQADVKKREIMRQQAGSGSGGNRSNVDLSTLFDKELQRQQQTNYETRATTEQPTDAASLLDKIRDLARRQDELNRRQHELAQQRDRLSAEELKRRLESLTREQSELRQRAEDLSRQMNEQSQSGQQTGQQNASADRGQGQRSQGAAGQPGPSGQQSRAGRGQSSGQQDQSSPAGSRTGQQMREVSDDMRNAASELRRDDPGKASERGARALEKLQALERRLRGAAPDEARRAMGELQLEARQLADAERQAAGAVAKVTQGDGAGDALRRLAGEQERLADRARRVQQALKAAASSGNGSGKEAGKNRQQTAGEAARELERQRVPERMQQAADELRAAADRAGDRAGRRTADAAAGTPKPTAGDTATSRPAGQTAADENEIARALDRLADTLAEADLPRDEESRTLAAERARARGLRQQIERLTAELERLRQQASTADGKPSRGGTRGATGNGTDLAELREDYLRQLQQTRELLDRLRRDDSFFGQGGAGFTFEGQGMTLSAPGTEAFKQDFARWEELRRQATQALEHAETTLSKKLQQRQAKDRLAAGIDDKPPAEYQTQVDTYFKALATGRRP